jgi:IclR family transcriptional regulator, KDG regulon repressor
MQRVQGALEVSESVRAVDRALDILLCFKQDMASLSLSHIAEQVDIPKSTAHRLLATLESRRFVYRDCATATYRLGFRFIEMAALVLQHADLQRYIQPHLHRLSAECGESVDLALLDDADVVYLQVVESAQRVRIAAEVGHRLPVFCTATGRAFMAYLPDTQVRTILSKGLTRYTESTRVTLPDLHEALRVTRELGFAMSEQEYERDINAVAAPILDANGYPVAVIAVVGPSFRLPRERMLQVGPIVRATTEAIAREMGPTALATLISQSMLPGNAGQTDQRGQ